MSTAKDRNQSPAVYRVFAIIKLGWQLVEARVSDMLDERPQCIPHE